MEKQDFLNKILKKVSGSNSSLYWQCSGGW